MKNKISALIVALVTISSTAIALAEDSKAKNNTGKDLIKQKGCLNCHFVQGDGGFIGPPLDGISSHRSKKQLIEVLTRPVTPQKVTNRYPTAEEIMKHVSLNKVDAEKIASYLLTLPDPNLKSKHTEKLFENSLPKGFKFTPDEPSKSSRKGMKLFNKNGCFACHSLDGKDDRLGPSLDGVGAYRSRAFIENRIARGALVIYAGKEYKPSRFSMPPSDLSKKQITQIADFLMTLPEKDI